MLSKAFRMAGAMISALVAAAFFVAMMTDWFPGCAAWTPDNVEWWWFFCWVDPPPPHPQALLVWIMGALA